MMFTYVFQPSLCRFASVPLLVLTIHHIVFAQSSGDFGVIHQRMVNDLLQLTDPVEIAPESPSILLANLNTDGTWSDVDYTDQSRASWGPRVHLERMLKMAQAYRQAGTSPSEQAALREGTLRAYDYWTTNSVVQTGNWWWRDIGEPRRLGRTMVLMNADLSASQRQAGLSVLSHGGISQTGQNLVWRSDITLMRGVMANDADIVQRAVNGLASTLQLASNSKEGIKADYSFHQHGLQLYNGGYGLSFMSDASRLAAQVRQTDYALDEANITVLTSYHLDAMQWMTRGQQLDYSVQGREIARLDASQTGPVMRDSVLHLTQVAPSRQDELLAFSARLAEPMANPTTALVGNRHFWKSDYTAHHRPEFMLSVRTHSSRTLGSEKVNDENLRGYYLAEGVTMLYQRGDEYTDIFPVWDWRKLPGTTIEQYAHDPPGPSTAFGREAFVGGASDGRNSVSVMDYNVSRVTARKSWFMIGDYMVALGTDIDAAESDNPVFTTLNQTLMHGPVVVHDARGQRTLSAGTHDLDDATWVHQDGVGYVFLESPVNVATRIGQQVGSWHDINKRYEDVSVTEDVFTVWIDHGSHVKDAGYAYMLAPGVTVDELANNEVASPVVVRNDHRAQAIFDAEQGVMAVSFFEADAVRFADMVISVDQAVLLMVTQLGHGIEVTLANPLNTALEVAVQVNQQLLGDGVEWNAETGMSTITAQLPDGEMAGNSITMSFGVVPEPSVMIPMLVGGIMVSQRRR